MAHKIQQNDKGVVGFSGKLGRTWHNLPQYRHEDGPVTIEGVKEVLSYECEKQDIFLGNGSKINGSKIITRTDNGAILGSPVGDDYTIVQNDHVIALAEQILSLDSSLKVESVGTLLNGAINFINFILCEYQVDGDISPTQSRLLIGNGFGGESVLESCIHETRIVCDNTRRLATQQGLVNRSLSRFKHTRHVHDRIAQKVVDLSHLILASNSNLAQLNQLAAQKINDQFVNDFLAKVFDIDAKKDSTRALSIGSGNIDSVKKIYFEKEDLTQLSHTKYRLYNAITDFADHGIRTRGDVDQGTRFLSNLNGNSDKLKQEAFQLLLA